MLFGIAISALAFYFALRNVDMSALLDSVFSADPAWMILVLVAYVIHFWLKAVRWCDLLKPVYRARAAEAFPVMMTGFFANNLLPAHLGEFVRMYVGSKAFGIRKTEVFTTIVLERILDFTMIALMFGVAMTGGQAVSDQLVYAGRAMIGVTVLAWLVIIVALRFESSAQRLVHWLLLPLPDRLGERVGSMFSLALAATHSLKSVYLVVRVAFLSLVQWALVGLAVHAALMSVGVEVGASGAMVVLAATVLAVSLPAAPGFFGTVQLAFVLALAPYGIPESAALAGSVIFHIVSYSVVMVSGVIALQQLDMRLSDLKQETGSGA